MTAPYAAVATWIMSAICCRYHDITLSLIRADILRHVDVDDIIRFTLLLRAIVVTSLRLRYARCATLMLSYMMHYAALRHVCLPLRPLILMAHIATRESVML